MEFMIPFQCMESRHGRESRMCPLSRLIKVTTVISLVIKEPKLTLLVIKVAKRIKDVRIVRIIIIKEVMRTRILRVINNLIQTIMKHRIQVITRIQVIKTPVTILMIKVALIKTRMIVLTILNPLLTIERNCPSSHLPSKAHPSCHVRTLPTENT